MPDSNKMAAQQYAESGVRDHLTDLEPWTEAQAVEMARQDGLELTDEHLAIIRYLRDCYADHGGTINAHILVHTLEDEFTGLGGHTFMSRLFPLGLIAQATRYAGLPILQGTRDPFVRPP